MTHLLGRVAQWLGSAGREQPGTYEVEGGEVLRIKTSPPYTHIELSGLEFYFVRDSGRFDGWGRIPADSEQATRWLEDADLQSGAVPETVASPFRK